MNSNTPSDRNPYRSHLQDQIQEMIHSGRTVRYHGDTETITTHSIARLLEIPKIDTEEANLVTDFSQIVTNRIVKHLDQNFRPLPRRYS